MNCEGAADLELGQGPLLTPKPKRQRKKTVQFADSPSRLKEKVPATVNQFSSATKKAANLKTPSTSGGETVRKKPKIKFTNACDMDDGSYPYEPATEVQDPLAPTRMPNVSAAVSLMIVLVWQFFKKYWNVGLQDLLAPNGMWHLSRQQTGSKPSSILIHFLAECVGQVV